MNSASDFNFLFDQYFISHPSLQSLNISGSILLWYLVVFRDYSRSLPNTMVAQVDPASEPRSGSAWCAQYDRNLFSN